VYQQRSKIGIPSLTNSQERWLATAGMLPRDQPQPGGKLPAVLETSGIVDGSYHRTRCDCADAGGLCQFLAGGAFPMPKLDLQFQFTDLAIKLLQMVKQALDQLPKYGW
jgi:hypothetical protein